MDNDNDDDDDDDDDIFPRKVSTSQLNHFFTKCHAPFGAAVACNKPQSFLHVTRNLFLRWHEPRTGKKNLTIHEPVHTIRTKISRHNRQTGLHHKSRE